MLINDMLARAVRQYGNFPALVDGEVRLTYKELNERVHRLAAALQGLGLEHGDHVAVLSHNSFRYMETYLAGSVAGVVIAPINTRLTARETAFILNDGETKALLLGADFVPMLAEIRGGLESVEHVILYQGEAPEGVLAYEDLLAAADPAAVAPRDWQDDDVAWLCYTGGTTGLPKGVMLTQQNVVSNARHAIQYAEYNERDIWLHVCPMFHLADSWSCVAFTVLGAFHVFQERFEPGRTLELIEQYKISAIIFVPTMINLLLDHPDAKKRDLSSLRRIVYGASPMPVERLKAAMELFGPILQQTYGQTETAPFLTATTLRGTKLEGSEMEVRRLASCGQELIGVEVRIVDESGNPVKPGEVGELIARGPNIMKGYWKRPEETAKTLVDGWVHTGDMATIDEEDWVFIVDRAKDMIVTGAENVYSTEVENALYRHADVQEAAVIGVPDNTWGEVVKAIVVRRPGRETTAEEVIAHCREWIAGFKCPKTVDFMDELPKSGAGKILKSELRKPFWEGKERRVN